MEKERVTGIKRIKSDEEYEETKNELNSYLKEYVWFRDKEKAISSIKNVVEKYEKKYEEEKDSLSETQKQGILRQIHLLQLRNDAISNGTFIPNLMQNITADVLSLEEYVSSKEKKSFFTILGGIMKGDDKIKEYITKKYALEMANITGNVPGKTNLDLSSRENVLASVSNELVKIEIPKEETSLTTINKEVTSLIWNTAQKMCNEFLRSQGLSNESIDKTNKDDMNNYKKVLADRKLEKDIKYKRKESSNTKEGEIEK